MNKIRVLSVIAASLNNEPFCIQEYFLQTVAYVVESFYNREHPRGAGGIPIK